MTTTRTLNARAARSVTRAWDNGQRIFFLFNWTTGDSRIELLGFANKSRTQARIKVIDELTGFGPLRLIQTSSIRLARTAR